MIVVVAIAAVIGWRNWQEAHEEEATDDPEDLLSSFEEAYEAGELDEEEIRKVRERLGGRPPGPKPEED